MKKIALLLISLSVTGASYAGFYTGVSVGITHINSKASSITNTPTDSQSQLATSGATGLIFLGWECSIEHSWAFAMDIYGALLGDKATIRNASTLGGSSVCEKITLQQKYAYGLRLLPGFAVTKDSRLSLILDVNSSRFSYSHTAHILVTPYTHKTTSKSQNLWGFGIGVSLLHKLTNNLAIAGEYTYNMYKRSSNIKDTDTGINDNYKPTVGQFNLKVRYSF